MIYSKALASANEEAHLRERDNAALENQLRLRWRADDYEAGLILADLARGGRETPGYTRDCNFAYYLYDEISKLKPTDDKTIALISMANYSIADMLLDKEDFVQATSPRRMDRVYERCLKAEPYGVLPDIFAAEGLAVMEGVPSHGRAGEADAFKIMDFGISKGSARCLFEKANILCADAGNEKRCMQGVPLMKEAVRKGYPEALAVWAESGLVGNNPTLTPEDTYALLQRAAFQNHARSNYNCALCLANGLGVERDLDKAQRYLEIAAQLGYPEAVRLVKLAEEYAERERKSNSLWGRLKRGFSAGSKTMVEGVVDQGTESLVEKLVKNLLNVN